MLTEIADYRTTLIMAHVLGVIIGAGGAFATDAMFFHSIRDGILSKKEISFLRLGSLMVWAGIFLIISAGLLLFSINPEGYLSSHKFLAKMTIVGILTINGAIFHFVHMPLFERHADTVLANARAFIRRSPFVMVSGAISTTSWLCAFMLGSIPHLPFSYGQVMGAYGLIITGAILTALLLRTRILHLEKSVAHSTSVSA